MNRLNGVQAIVLMAVCGVMPPAALAQDRGVCVRGTPAAPIRIDVFSDYECSTCRAFYQQTLKPLFAEYADKGRLCVVFREFPLFEHAFEAARLARAALRLGPRQWGLVADALFQFQPQWSQSGNPEAVVASALSARDMTALRAHLKDPSLDAVIENEMRMGLKLNVSSTPTFFITAHGQTEKIEAALTYASMQRRMDDLLR